MTTSPCSKIPVLGIFALAFVHSLAVVAGTPANALPSPIKERWVLTDPDAHWDFPAMALDSGGAPWIAFTAFDGKSDVLKLARKSANELNVVGAVSQPGIVHQPAIAVAKDGAVWCFWGQVDARDVVTLRARRYADGKFDNEITLAQSAASDTFADAGTDAAGRIWVVWQSLRRGQGDIFARWLDPKSGAWSPEIAVSKPEGGNWEPRVAFDGRDGAWVVFDSSRGTAFNLYLAHVGLDGHVEEKQLTSSPFYEARASIAAGKDGKGFWIAAERGRKNWGLQMRGHEGANGLNGQKHILLGWYDIADGKFTEIDVPHSGRMAPREAAEVNLPVVSSGPAGNPWLAYRFNFMGYGVEICISVMIFCLCIVIAVKQWQNTCLVAGVLGALLVFAQIVGGSKSSSSQTTTVPATSTVVLPSTSPSISSGH